MTGLSTAGLFPKTDPRTKLKILLTGFGPFLNHIENPSQFCIEALNGKVINNAEVVGVILPVEIDALMNSWPKDFVLEEYSAVICLGLAESRDKITPERVAINCLHNPNRPDNAGSEYSHKKISEDSEDAFFSTLPLEEIEKTLGEDVETSNTAGTYVCNQVMYLLMQELKKRNLKIPAGFVHIPSAGSKWPQDKINKSVELVIRETTKQL